MNPIEFTLGQQRRQNNELLPRGCSESFKRGYFYEQLREELK